MFTGQLATFAPEDNGRTYTISTSGVRWRRRDYAAVRRRTVSIEDDGVTVVLD
ncbi:hypothetical protein ABCR94_16695 [Streptomyces sp. 21So2-11]|uniref:hypothetical protein n=1 Tax=Streptomyces sp. 21So2-11 TaxID=3144408 RepID=UPI00321AFB74